jgi:hypothetical protein
MISSALCVAIDPVFNINHPCPLVRPSHPQTHLAYFLLFHSQQSISHPLQSLHLSRSAFVSLESHPYQSHSYHRLQTTARLPEENLCPARVCFPSLLNLHLHISLITTNKYQVLSPNSAILPVLLPLPHLRLSDLVCYHRSTVSA